MFPPKSAVLRRQGLRQNYLTQMGKLKDLAYASLGAGAIVIGEVGLPFDINSRHAYRTGDYTKQHQLLDALINAMEKLAWIHAVGTTTRTTESRTGRVNYEDFSLPMGSSRGRALKPDFRNAAHESDELYRGGRCLESIVRPYAVKVAGEQMYTSLTWRRSSSRSTGTTLPTTASRVTEIFLPAYHYRHKRFSITTTTPETLFNAELQTLYVTHTDTRPGVLHKLKIELDDPHAHRLDRLRQRETKLGKGARGEGNAGQVRAGRSGVGMGGGGLAQVVSLGVVGVVLVGLLMLADYH